MKREIDELNARVNEEGVKRSQKNNETDRIQREKAALEEKLNSALRQIDLMGNQIRNSEQELNNLRKRILELENAALTVKSLETRLLSFEQQNQRLTDLLRQRDEEIKGLKIQANQLTINIQ